MSDPVIPPDPSVPPPSSVPPVTPTVTPTVDYATPPNTATGMFAPPPAPMGIEADPNARTWGLIAHLSGLAGFVIPFGNIVGPLIVWQIKKTEIPFAADQAKEALNFHITVGIMVIVCLALMCVVVGFFLLPIVGIYALAFTIIGAVKANNGEWYRYPATIRLVK